MYGICQCHCVVCWLQRWSRGSGWWTWAWTGASLTKLCTSIRLCTQHWWMWQTKHFELIVGSVLSLMHTVWAKQFLVRLLCKKKSDLHSHFSFFVVFSSFWHIEYFPAGVIFLCCIPSPSLAAKNNGLGFDCYYHALHLKSV